MTMNKKPIFMSDSAWDALNNPDVKRVTDAMEAWDKGDISAVEMKAVIEETPIHAPYMTKKLIEMCEAEINKHL